MKPLPPALAALSVSLLAAPPALGMDQRQADAICATWKLECPEGTTAGSSGPGKGTGALECKLKGRPVKEGPLVACKGGKALAWWAWKTGKKHGLQVTLRPNGSWTEELFSDGKQDGRSVEYSAEGQLLKETPFQSGKKHGLERSFNEDGRLASEQLWDKGVKSKKPALTVSADDLPVPTEQAKPKAEPPEGEEGAEAGSPSP
jgi:hypothetical protein